MSVHKHPSAGSPDTPKEVTFHFEGNPLKGFAGEPIAKALFRAGIRTLSYSLKYHLAQGISCGRGRCGKCSMEVNGFPGVPTCITPLEDEMKIRREDFRPFFAPLFSAAARKLPLPAGFYYRLFTKPAFLKNHFVRNVRHMAGVGRLDAGGTAAAPVSSSAGTFALDHIQPYYDIAIVGAGISGMSAALAAADALLSNGQRANDPTGSEHAAHRARILLVDEYSGPGGHSIGYQRDSELDTELRRLSAQIIKQPSIEYAPATTAQGLYPPSELLIASRGGTFASPGIMKRITARAFVFVTGANDMLPLFENNSLPGVFGPRAMRLLLERDGYEFGNPAVVYGAGKQLVDTISLLIARGVEISAIVEAREISKRPHDNAEIPADIKRFANARLISTAGKNWIRSAVFRSIDGEGGTFTVPCRLLCIAFRGQGAYELPYQAGFDLHFSDATIIEEKILLPGQTERSHESGTAYYLAGEITGESNWVRKIEQGKQAGAKAAAAARAFHEGQTNG
jgi:sarcosine oxidase subunit alpha